jgi:hypothetical protein
MRSININSNDGLFPEIWWCSLEDTTRLQSLIKKLQAIKGVIQVDRSRQLVLYQKETMASHPTFDGCFAMVYFWILIFVAAFSLLAQDLPEYLYPLSQYR